MKPFVLMVVLVAGAAQASNLGEFQQVCEAHVVFEGQPKLQAGIQQEWVQALQDLHLLGSSCDNGLVLTGTLQVLPVQKTGFFAYNLTVEAAPKSYNKLTLPVVWSQHSFGTTDNLASFSLAPLFKAFVADWQKAHP